MYKSVIDFIEVGKDKSVHWLIRCQDIFLGIFLFVGGSFLLFFGVILLLAGQINNVSGQINGGIVAGISGLVAITVFFTSRRKGKYESYSSWISCICLALTILGLIFTGNTLPAGVLCVIFPLFSCILFHIKHGSLISIILLMAYFGCGLFLGNDPWYFLIAPLFAGIVFLIVACGFLISNEELLKANANKISGIQKETEIKNEFISELSHQIRTPLNNIVVIGKLLNDTQLNQRQKDWMETILASANNLVSVVNIITSKVASTGIVDAKPSIISFNLQTVMNNTIQLFVGQSEEYNIALKPNMDASYILEGDPIQIKQIFLTLIDAIVKNKKAEKINIIIAYRVKQETENLFNVTFEIKVSDQLYFEEEDNKKNTEMLNYSISSKLIAMSGSKLEMTYDDKGFTIFHFALSFKKAHAETETKKAKEPENFESEEIVPLSKSSTRELKDANILLVEDNLINQRIVILSIQKLVKHIEVANNGQEAVDKFNAAKHDIILMDIQMPIMDGIQATKKIREIEVDKRIIPTPIIAITANALAGDREHCLASGMDEYISKPFQVEVLVNKMKNLLSVGSSIQI